MERSAESSDAYPGNIHPEAFLENDISPEMLAEIRMRDVQAHERRIQRSNEDDNRDY